MQKAGAIRFALAMAGTILMFAGAANAQDGGRTLTRTLSQAQLSVALKNAIPAEKRLPALPAEFSQPRPKATLAGLPQFAPGYAGGKAVAATAAAATDVPTADDAESGIEPKNFGCKQGGCGVGTNINTIFHYNDSRLDPTVVPRFPYRASGFFLHTFDNSTFFFCTATLISRSILVTAGHCVYDTNINKFIVAGTFIPACINCNAASTPKTPYGSAPARFMATTVGWRTAANESVALDKGFDVAVVTLGKRSPPMSAVEMGSVTGFMGFCHTNCLQPFWQLSQLGYPTNYDGGNRMQYGEHIEQSDTRDYMLGSGMGGGSSGGPHVSNIGVLLDSSTDKGRATARNRIFAVTSWGFTDPSRKIQGASSLSGPKNSNNFKALFNSACAKARAFHGSASCALLP